MKWWSALNAALHYTILYYIIIWFRSFPIPLRGPLAAANSASPEREGNFPYDRFGETEREANFLGKMNKRCVYGSYSIKHAQQRWACLGGRCTLKNPPMLHLRCLVEKWTGYVMAHKHALKWFYTYKRPSTTVKWPIDSTVTEVFDHRTHCTQLSWFFEDGAQPDKRASAIKATIQNECSKWVLIKVWTDWNWILKNCRLRKIHLRLFLPPCAPPPGSVCGRHGWPRGPCRPAQAPARPSRTCPSEGW